MEGKELLKYFKTLPYDEQTKILVDAYGQIDILHGSGRSYKSFDWHNCRFDNGVLTIDAPISEHFVEEDLQRNLTDYAGIIYCLSAGNNSAESMGWDGGRKIKPAVLREIVLTICGRNESVEPLIKKLRQAYVDEDTFFDGYTTVDEKEGREAYERKKKIEAQSDVPSAENLNRDIFHQKNKKFWGKGIGIFILMALYIGGAKLYKTHKAFKQQQTVEQIKQNAEQVRQERQIIRNSNMQVPLRDNKVDSIDKLIKNAEDILNKSREGLKHIQTNNNVQQLSEKHEQIQQSLQHLQQLQQTRDQMLQQNSNSESEDTIIDIR